MQGPLGKKVIVQVAGATSTAASIVARAAFGRNRPKDSQLASEGRQAVLPELCAQAGLDYQGREGEDKQN